MVVFRVGNLGSYSGLWRRDAARVIYMERHGAQRDWFMWPGRYGIVFGICMLLLISALGGASEEVCSSESLNRSFDGVLNQHVCDVTGDAHAASPGEKLEKQFPTFGHVARRGVDLPVTTLFNAHTREILPVFENTRIKTELLKHFFRCRGFGETIDMAPELIATIVDAAKEFKAKRVTVISGYRSPKFNDTLAKKGRRVASESKHMKGQAVDFRLDTVEAKELGPWIRARFEGGVGTYRGDNFIHIDVGPKRSWNGR